MNRPFLAGLDVGSTTTKIVVTDESGADVLYSCYRRHNTNQASTAAVLLREAHKAIPDAEFRLAVCGSGGEPVAEAIGANYVQEVTAMALVVSRYYPGARTAIELGGQDAKVVTFIETPNGIEPGPMRMNGACAGGTGAFIDQIAALLSIPIDVFDLHARQGNRVYDVSGRCGVFAKTDVQPLLNAGASRADLALSCFHAIARQTIGGLAQGLRLAPHIVFAGGPLTFNEALVRVFQEQLGLTEQQSIRPARPELLVAHGAALSNATLFAHDPGSYSVGSIARLEGNIEFRRAPRHPGSAARPFFTGSADAGAFFARHAPVPEPQSVRGTEADFLPSGRYWLGVDAGSTTSKFVLLDDEDRVAYTYYHNNEGDPLSAFFEGFGQLASRVPPDSPLRLAGVGVTGYGTGLLAAALEADHTSVETVAHARAAQEVQPDVSAIIDIGGQDMKVIFMENGVVADIIVNEACSAGCGSFLESYAASLDVPVGDVASSAFRSTSPAVLGSRCTVFMNSAVITELKQGHTREDILAGICNSVVENVFGKVIRPHNISRLGKKIVVQGGTYRNDAVLRATERYLGMHVERPAHPGHMGAIGAALLLKEAGHTGASRDEEIERVTRLLGTSFLRESAPNCSRCPNNCVRSLVRFSHGGVFVSGNRCERGATIERPKTAGRPGRDTDAAPNLFDVRKRAVFADYPVAPLRDQQEVTIGIPRVLDIWESAPFWTTLFRALGYRVMLSRETTQKQFESGLSFVTSDTICLPAKVAHGHVHSLIEQGVDMLFMPQMAYGLKDNPTARGGYYCTLLQGLPMVLESMHETEGPVRFEHPIFHWYTRSVRNKQIREWLKNAFDVPGEITTRAIGQADAAMLRFSETIRRAGMEALQAIGDAGDFGVIIASRPYHLDRFLNHDVARHFAARGIAVLTPEALPETYRHDLDTTRMESTVAYHMRVVEAAMTVAEYPQLELVQLVSFGCGHDAITADEATRLLRERAHRSPLVLKLDDFSARGPLQLRIDSFIETVRLQRNRTRSIAADRSDARGNGERPSGQGRDNRRYTLDYGPRFERRDRRRRIVYAPVLSEAFSICMSRIIAHRGYRFSPLPAANARAIELGKRYVHNDMCFPAQVNVGEFLAEAEAGRIDPATATLGLAKNCEYCRAGQYAVVARKALDDAGYPGVPILTTGSDSKRLHPGYRMGVRDLLRALWAITIADELERIRRRLRPYEREPGSADRLFRLHIEDIARLVPRSIRAALRALSRAIDAFNALPVSDEPRRPRVGIVGEVLLNNHPTANMDIEHYLERHGMEVVVPDLQLFFRKEQVIRREIARRGWRPFAALRFAEHTLIGGIYDGVRRRVREVGRQFRLDGPVTWIDDIARAIKGSIDLTYHGAEGWKLPGEILTMAAEGVRSFVIVQPFGCIPNHVTGRGFIKEVLSKAPDLQIVSLDFDPDTSRANVENRLQMLIMREKMRASGAAAPGFGASHRRKPRAAITEHGTENPAPESHTPERPAVEAFDGPGETAGGN